MWQGQSNSNTAKSKGVARGVLGCPWPPFCTPFLTKQPTTGGENAIFVFHVVYSIKKAFVSFFNQNLFSANAVLIAKYDITVLQIDKNYYCLFVFFFTKERTWKISLQISRRWCLPTHPEMSVVWLSLYKAQYQMDVWTETGPLMTFIHDILHHGLGYLKTRSRVSYTPWTGTHKLLLRVTVESPVSGHPWDQG